MLEWGTTCSIDDNLFYGLAQAYTNFIPYTNDYYFMRAKTFTDAAFYVGFTTLQVGSTAAATALSGVSLVAGKMAQHSKGLHQSSTSKLTSTIGYKIRNVADNILDVMEDAGGHTLQKHVSMTNEELINRAITEGDATSFNDKSTAIKSVQQNLRKNADQIEEWMKSTNSMLTIECKHPYTIGYGAKSGSKQITYGLTSSKIFMVKDSTLSLGFKIITAYPIF